MASIIALVFLGTVSFAICQSWLIRQLRYRYSKPVAPWPTDRPLPKAAVLLSLRGNDPFLVSCLRNLLFQDYPDFIVQVVIDSETDPAWSAIRTIRAERDDPRLFVSVLHHRRTNCSLKNSSILQSLSVLPEDREVVAFVDADAITHRTWLRELVAPLADPEVGCSTGIRWFAPNDRSLASRMRCYWNLVAASVIHYSQTPWGGSMVVRRSVLDTGLADEWSRMFCEDAFTIKYLDQHGLKLVCVPQATVVNEETTSVSGCIRFVNRQMLIFRLYHRQWWGVIAMIAFATATRLTHLHFLFQSLIHADWISAAALAVIHPIILWATQYEAVKLDRAVRTMVTETTGRQIARNPIPDFFGYFCTEVMFLGSLLYAMCARTVQWRGITYRIRGPKDITMQSYRPFKEVATHDAAQSATVV